VLDKPSDISAPPSTVTRAQSAVPRALKRYLALDDFEPAARQRLPKFLYGYISGGAETDAAVRDNRRAFDEYGFVPRVLNDVSGRNQTTTLFGTTYASPFGIPPMGSSALCAYRGDIVLTPAAAGNLTAVIPGVEIPGADIPAQTATVVPVQTYVSSSSSSSSSGEGSTGGALASASASPLLAVAAAIATLTLLL